jgi:hypothetical protein
MQPHHHHDHDRTLMTHAARRVAAWLASIDQDAATPDFEGRLPACQYGHRADRSGLIYAHLQCAEGHQSGPMPIGQDMAQLRIDDLRELLADITALASDVGDEPPATTDEAITDAGSWLGYALAAEDGPAQDRCIRTADVYARIAQAAAAKDVAAAIDGLAASGPR